MPFLTVTPYSPYGGTRGVSRPWERVVSTMEARGEQKAKERERMAMEKDELYPLTRGALLVPTQWAPIIIIPRRRRGSRSRAIADPFVQGNLG